MKILNAITSFCRDELAGYVQVWFLDQRSQKNVMYFFRAQDVADWDSLRSALEARFRGNANVECRYDQLRESWIRTHRNMAALGNAQDRLD